jgi:CHAT domain-containing protein
LISESGRSRAFADLLTMRHTSERGINQIVTEADKLSLQDIQTLRKQLNNSIFVQYSIIPKWGDMKDIEEKLFIWVIDSFGYIHFKQQKPPSFISDMVKNLSTELGVRGRDGRNIEIEENNERDGYKKVNVSNITTCKYEDELEKLYELLIAPIEEWLPKDLNQRVIIIPDRELFLVPFHCLKNKKGKYLIEEYNFTMAPSIQILQLLQKHKKNEFITLLNLKEEKEFETTKQEFDVLKKLNDNQDVDEELLLAMKMSLGLETRKLKTQLIGNPNPMPIWNSKQLCSLQGAEEEVLEIHQILPNSQLYIKEKALKNNIMSQMIESHIIHFATHGLLDAEGGGSLALANEFLTTQEIFELQLKNGPMVILSACDTAQGKICADGVIGLVRSFLVAGASTVIATYWSVSDEATKELMIKFYTLLKEKAKKELNTDISLILRESMLDLMKKYPHPRYWAPFVYVG